MKKRLGVNIDHIATLRQVRLGRVPELRRALPILAESGADGVTAHLREDRRHIQEKDAEMLAENDLLPLNLELSVKMVDFALRLRPHSVCLVPENRDELTTEGGLDVIKMVDVLGEKTAALKRAGCKVSLFVEAEPRQLDAAIAVAPDAVELHTGSWCEAHRQSAGQGVGQNGGEAMLSALVAGAKQLRRSGVVCHAGHGLDYETTAVLAKIDEIAEFNIGHFLVGEALFVGLAAAVAKMREAIDAHSG